MLVSSPSLSTATEFCGIKTIKNTLTTPHLVTAGIGLGSQWPTAQRATGDGPGPTGPRAHGTGFPPGLHHCTVDSSVADVTLHLAKLPTRFLMALASCEWRHDASEEDKLQPKASFDELDRGCLDRMSLMLLTYCEGFCVLCKLSGIHNLPVPLTL